ncbi:MAG: ASCH domain-containing protein [Candidatus Paceibacterota bacterium]
MKKSWGLTDKILTGEKKIESRWYASNRSPWDRVEVGDTVYFKNSGEPITLKSGVEKVFQFSDLTPKKVQEILKVYGADDGITKRRMKDFFNLFKDKKYCILIFLEKPLKIKPFEINKAGFGAMSAWVTVDNISKIKK